MDGVVVGGAVVDGVVVDDVVVDGVLVDGVVVDGVLVDGVLVDGTVVDSVVDVGALVVDVVVDGAEMLLAGVNHVVALPACTATLFICIATLLVGATERDPPSTPLSSLENKRHTQYSVGDVSTTNPPQTQPLRIKKISENQLRYDSLYW